MKNVWMLKWLALFLFLPTPAMAYIDPGTGSLMLQAAIGAVAVALVAIKGYWHKLKGMFSRPKDDAPSE